MYTSMFPKVDPETLVKVFWGDYYFNPDSRKFMTLPTKEANTRTFVQFILEPVYKIFAHTVSHEYDKLAVSSFCLYSNHLALLVQARNLPQEGRLQERYQRSPEDCLQHVLRKHKRYSRFYSQVHPYCQGGNSQEGPAILHWPRKQGFHDCHFQM